LWLSDVTLLATLLSCLFETYLKDNLNYIYLQHMCVHKNHTQFFHKLYFFPASAPCNDLDPQGCAVNPSMCKDPVLSVVTCPRSCNRCRKYRCFYFYILNLIIHKVNITNFEFLGVICHTYLVKLLKATRRRKHVLWNSNYYYFFNWIFPSFILFYIRCLSEINLNYTAG